MSHSEKDLIEENKKLSEEITRLKLALKENIYEKLFDASPDVIIQVDPSYKMIVLHVPEIPRKRLDELRGTDLFSVTPEVLHTKMRNALEKVFTLGETIHYESEAESLGKYRYYLNYLTPLKNEQGKTTSAYFISREITEQKLSEKLRTDSEKKLMALFESSQHLHILLDKDQRILWFNQKANDTGLVLFKRALTIGEKMQEYYLEKKHKDTFLDYFNQALSGDVISFPRHYVLEENKNFYLDMMLQSIYEDATQQNLVGVSLSGVETTDRRANEIKLEKINKELIQHNQQLNQYSFVISHNLRGPIVTLLGLVNLFEQKTTDDNFKNEIIQHIKKSTLHLGNIILDLNMILSQSDGRETMRSKIIFATELQMAEDLLKSQIEFAQATITSNFEAVPLIVSVRSYIQSIFMNLISNSLKYKKINQPAIIHIQSSLSASNIVRIDFQDNGIGFNVDKHEDSLFGFYKRFHTHVDGKGLGLHLIKTQVDILGGRIEVQSTVNEGTTFSVYLPVA
ncbi:MAG TPA: PAS domain-containing protein [Cytophagaceae bacterium]|jgi:signal transduction histidine kinase|nr:PAS domain-containing protein [Cytophagaceae bacterium]